MDRRLALVLSILFHLAVFGAGMVSWRWFGRGKPVEVTPVTLLTSKEVAELMAAEESPEPAPAATEDPVIAEPLPEAPAPAPVPKAAAAPAAPTPKVAPTPAPTPKAKTPTPKAPETPATPKTAPVNLDKLAEDLAKTSKRAAGAPKTAGQKGPSRAETDLAARDTQGQARATSQTALSTLVDRLNREWRPACGVDGAPNVNVRLRLNENGSLQRAELIDYRNAVSANDVDDPAVRAAATLALSAAARASPYLGLPREDYSYWQAVRVVFDGKKACERR